MKEQHFASQRAPEKHAQLARLILGLCGMYLIATCVVWSLIACLGDRWWFATVMLYAPRWIYLFPLLLLAPLAAWRARWGLIPLSLGTLLVFGPIMGFNVPRGPTTPKLDLVLRVLTCNLADRPECRQSLAQLVLREQPDIVALQECAHVAEFTWPEGWHVQRQGSQLVASRYPISEAEESLRLHPYSQWPPINAIRCTIAYPMGEITFCNVHLATPRPGLERVLRRWTLVNPSESWELTTLTIDRRLESQQLAKWLADSPRPCIIVGDFNQTPDSAIFQEFWASQYTDAFAATGWGYGYTKMTPKRPTHYGSRIDHILYDRSLGCSRCWVGPNIGSDHKPLMADLALAR